MAFEIKGLGIYRMRNGKKATVTSSFGVWQERLLWKGTTEGLEPGTFILWVGNSGRVNAFIDENEWDIVGEWSKPTFIDSPRDYVTRDGRRAVVLSVAAPGEKPVIGYYQSCAIRGVHGHAWMLSGASHLNGEQSEVDIVDKWVEPLMTMDFWTIFGPRKGEWSATANEATARQYGGGDKARHIFF